MSARFRLVLKLIPVPQLGGRSRKEDLATTSWHLSAEVLVERQGRSRSTDVSCATGFILATILDLAADPDECEFAQAFSSVGSLNTEEDSYGENISPLPAEGGSPNELGMDWLQSWTAPDKQIEVVDGSASG